jgi:alpha-galactosidase
MRNILRTTIFVSAMALSLSSASLAASYNGLANTPPMGWNSWNKFGCKVSDDMIRGHADAMVSSGMAKAGYQYINIDDCWQELGRDANKHVRPTSSFPNMKALADYVHSKGLKLGVYSDRGTKTCGGREGAHGFETVDATDYAAWGVDYLKYDNCFPAPGSNIKQDYENMRDALVKSGSKVVFSICAWEFFDWAPATGNLWRTTLDIKDNWSRMLEMYDGSVGYAKYAKPGAWNDPDMLEVGNGGMTDTEYRTHMSLWAIMAAPLIAGNDLRSMSAATKAILTAPEIIAVDQDSLGIQGVEVRDAGNTEVLSRTVTGGNVRAVALFNRGAAAATIKVSWNEIGLPTGKASVRDLWAGKDVGEFDGSYSVSVPSHGTAMLRITNGTPVSLVGRSKRQGSEASLFAGNSPRDFRLIFSTAPVNLALTLTDLRGRSQPFQQVRMGSGEVRLNLPGLESGVYSLQVVTGGSVENIRVAIVH